jgi:TonB family protein
MKDNVPFRSLALLTIALIGFAGVGFSQSTKSGKFAVEGQGNNPEGEKAVGATVLVKGTTIGTFQEKQEVFDRVEENPRPEPGDDGWYVYLSKNIKYSQNDRAAGVEGTVIVGFEIHADGSVQNVAVLRGVGGECDQEAVRVVNGGPKWEPGKIAGQAVNTRMSMPIQFKLTGSSSTNSLERSRETAIAKLYDGSGVVVIGYLAEPTR